MKLIIFLMVCVLLVSVRCDILDENAYLYLLDKGGANAIIGKLNAAIVVRIQSTVAVAAFDALAPFQDTAVGINTNIRRFPASQRTKRNKNTAIAYAVFRVLTSYSSDFQPGLLSAFGTLKLDPNNTSLDVSTPIGVGNYAAKITIEQRQNDGMNTLGNKNGKNYKTIPYEDYINYEPKNSPYKLDFIGRWQPNVEPTFAYGVFTAQTMLYPQLGEVKPYSIANKDNFVSLKPYMLLNRNCQASKFYVSQTDEVIKLSKDLNDYTKMEAEHFDDKIASLFDPLVYITEKAKLPMEQFVIMDAIRTIALFDASIVVWKEKLKHDTVRPFSAIRFLYENVTIEAWGGPKKGTVNNITGKEWQSYLRTAPHPDYPSGTACFCSAEFEGLRLYLGNDKLDYSVIKQKGTSRVEPNFTPASNITLGPYKDFNDYVDACANARVTGGVHFRAAADEGKRFCKPVGNTAYQLIKRRLAGKTDM